MSKTKVKFLGHTTVQVQSQNVNFIFDPNFINKLCSLKRKDKPVILTEELHNINAILISNAHRNRLNLDSLKYFKQVSQIVLPMGVGKVFKNFFQFHFNELKAGAQTTIGDCEIHAIRSLHRGSRGLGFKYKNSLNYIIKMPHHKLFYCSDTKYEGAYFHKIGKEHKIDLAILPIDHVGPDLISRKRYMTASQALHAFRDLGAAKMIPNCYGAFNFSGRTAKKVLKGLNQEIEKHDLKDKVAVLQPGEEIEL